MTNTDIKIDISEDIVELKELPIIKENPCYSLNDFDSLIKARTKKEFINNCKNFEGNFSLKETILKIDTMTPFNDIKNLLDKIMEPHFLKEFIKIESSDGKITHCDPKNKQALFELCKVRINNLLKILSDEREDRKRVVFSGFFIKALFAFFVYISLVVPYPGDLIIQTILFFLGLIELYKKMVFELINSQIERGELYDDKQLIYNPLETWLCCSSSKSKHKKWISFTGYVSKFTGEINNWHDRPFLFEKIDYEKHPLPCFFN